MSDDFALPEYEWRRRVNEDKQNKPEEVPVTSSPANASRDLPRDVRDGDAVYYNGGKYEYHNGGWYRITWTKINA